MANRALTPGTAVILPDQPEQELPIKYTEEEEVLIDIASLSKELQRNSEAQYTAKMKTEYPKLLWYLAKHYFGCNDTYVNSLPESKLQILDRMVFTKTSFAKKRFWCIETLVTLGIVGPSIVISPYFLLALLVQGFVITPIMLDTSSMFEVFSFRKARRLLLNAEGAISKKILEEAAKSEKEGEKR